MSSSVPKVSVAMLAYNHEKYVAQAIESVLAQETNFPVELVIGEDQSTDRTRAICQEYAARYPDRIRLFLRDRNDPGRRRYPLPVFFNVGETWKACQGDYVAYLDGDDYWTDPRKLQHQADLLDRDPGVVLCADRYRRLYEERNEMQDDRFDAEFAGRSQIEINYDNFLQPPLLLSSFMMVRRTALVGYFDKQVGWDTALWAHVLSGGGRGIVANRYTGVYRRHGGGVWSALADRDVHMRSHMQNTMLLQNEGLRSKCIAEAYRSGSLVRSHDLVEIAVEAHQAWERHAFEVSDAIARQNGTQTSRLMRSLSRQLSAIQERLLRGQAENVGQSCRPRLPLARRLVRQLLFGLLVIAASPLMLFVALTRSLRRTEPVDAPKQT